MELTIENIRQVVLDAWNAVKRVFNKFIEFIQPYLPQIIARTKYNKRITNRQRLYEKRRRLGRC